MTATVIGLPSFVKCSSTLLASGIRSISMRPQVGQATSVGAVAAQVELLRMSKQTGISSVGSAASETRIVSPMPSASRMPMPMALRTVPARGVPASVTPRCSG